jgi:hypothetical protein
MQYSTVLRMSGPDQGRSVDAIAIRESPCSCRPADADELLYPHEKGRKKAIDRSIHGYFAVTS